VPSLASQGFGTHLSSVSLHIFDADQIISAIMIPASRIFLPCSGYSTYNSIDEILDT
jgi:hypothetical protein